jgi:predicted transcriptional regulator
MSNIKIKPRYVTGITLDSEIQVYLDDLAARMRSSRSWVLNTIVYEYARMIEKKNLQPLAGVLPPPASKETVIRL